MAHGTLFPRPGIELALSALEVTTGPPGTSLEYLYHVHKSLQSSPALCDPLDCSPPGSSAHGILQARMLEWVAVNPLLAPPGDLPNPGVKPKSLTSPAMAGGFFATSTAWEAHLYHKGQQMLHNRTPMPPTPLHHHPPKSRSTAHTCLSQPSHSSPLSSLSNGCTGSKYRLL